MRFRYGWRKEPKDQKHIKAVCYEENETYMPEDQVSIDNDLQVIIVKPRPESNVVITTRIIFFGDEEGICGLYSLYLRSKGYEVFHYPSPMSCALMSQQKCTCPRDHVCADIIITEMEMEGMSGLDLMRHQYERECRVLPCNKAIISNKFITMQEYEAKALGCKLLRKPFRLLDVMEWVNECERTIPASRELTPFNELLEVPLAGGHDEKLICTDS